MERRRSRSRRSPGSTPTSRGTTTARRTSPSRRTRTTIQQVAVDLETGEALEDVRAVWGGSGLYAPEGPHLYRRDDWWYLLVAEGGTDRGHAVTIAREPLAARAVRELPAQPGPHRPGAAGSRCRTRATPTSSPRPDGGDAMVLLGVRPAGSGAGVLADGPRDVPGRRHLGRRLADRLTGRRGHGRRAGVARRRPGPAARPRVDRRTTHAGRGRDADSGRARHHRRRHRPRRDAAVVRRASGSGTRASRSRPMVDASAGVGGVALRWT